MSKLPFILIESHLLSQIHKSEAVWAISPNAQILLARLLCKIVTWLVFRVFGFILRTWSYTHRLHVFPKNLHSHLNNNFRTQLVENAGTLVRQTLQRINNSCYRLEFFPNKTKSILIVQTLNVAYIKIGIIL